MANSEGAVAKDVSSIFTGYMAVNADDGDAVSTASESDSSRFMNIDPESIALKACEIAKKSRKGQTINTGDIPVVLDHHAAAGLLGTFYGAFNADNIQRGRSVYADKVGTTSSNPVP